jgi:hypothetical protein
MYRDPQDDCRRGRCIQLPTNEKPTKEWFLGLPPPDKTYRQINANIAFYAKILQL